MSMRINARLDARGVLRSIPKLRKANKRITAQELNRQRAKSRTLMTRELKGALGVRPQFRIRRRIVLPRSTRATERNLRAEGFALLALMPARYWVSRGRGRGGKANISLPPHTRIATTVATRGQPFVAPMRGSKPGAFRRGANATHRQRSDGQWTALPIKTVWVDTSRPAAAALDRALTQLSREFPGQWANRMRREIKRTMG
jgi:hypothetical protein